MPRLIARSSPPGLQTRPLSFWDRVKELDMFFQGRDPVHRCLRRVVKKLEKAKIPYAVIGGMAVFAHRHQRPTKDVDLLLTAESPTQVQGSCQRSHAGHCHYRTFPGLRAARADRFP